MTGKKSNISASFDNEGSTLVIRQSRGNELSYKEVLEAVIKFMGMVRVKNESQRTTREA